MPTLRLQMDRPTFVKRLYELPGTLSGRISDTSNILEPVLMAGALAVLYRLHQHAQRLTQGGTGDDGTKLEPLKPSTLILRKKVTTKAALGRLVSEIRKQGSTRRRLFLTQLKRARQVFSDIRQRRVALGILRKMKPSIPDKRYNELLKLLKSKPPAPVRRSNNASARRNELYDRLDAARLRKYQQRLNVVAFAAAGALILVDTTRMITAFSPSYSGSDQKREVGKGFFEIDNNVEYFKFHQSDEPRKIGKDGKPVLPRRNLIPDIIPQAWIDEAREAMMDVLGSVQTLKRYFEGAV